MILERLLLKILAHIQRPIIEYSVCYIPFWVIILVRVVQCISTALCDSFRGHRLRHLKMYFIVSVYFWFRNLVFHCSLKSIRITSPTFLQTYSDSVFCFNNVTKDESFQFVDHTIKCKRVSNRHTDALRDGSPTLQCRRNCANLEITLSCCKTYCRHSKWNYILIFLGIFSCSSAHNHRHWLYLIFSKLQIPNRLWAITGPSVKSLYIANENFNEHILGK